MALVLQEILLASRGFVGPRIKPAGSAFGLAITNDRKQPKIMNPDFLGSALHIVLGPSAGGTMNQVLRPHRGRRLVGEDALACGPAPAMDDLELWRAIREWFLNKIYRANGMEFSFDGYDDAGLLMNASWLDEEEEIVVWTGTGLADQLNLAWTVLLCDRHGVDLAKLRVIQFERQGSWPVRAMAELHPDTIRDHCPAPRALAADDVEELRRAWRVYTSNDPAALVDYAAGTSPLPFLHEGLSALLLRYPDRRSGLGVIDETLLRNVKRKGGKPMNVVGETTAWNDSPDRWDHVYVFYRLLRMADLETPLVTLTGRTKFEFAIPPPQRLTVIHKMICDGEVKLTPFGAAVLAGEANAVHENGIDDWIGGVHLTDAERPPFREGRTLLLD
jgi:hypothetical protein